MYIDLDCENGWDRFEKNCYKFEGTLRNQSKWDEARNHCSQQDSHLASIHSDEEQNAINNILPKKAQFYKTNEFPDYDFFSNDALSDAKKLADIYFKQGYGNVEAKSGVHVGTYKVYVNFFNIADITQLDKIYYDNLKNKPRS